ncbi:MAG TPA: nucleotidyltransferase family protein, partial [Candidatus Binatus sp.]|nr:nucleotidyltransferase family protein [Candidatus Binatus sp.]
TNGGAQADANLASARKTSAALERRVRQGHATDFVNRARLQLDLHWYALPENRGPEADHDFWSDAVPVRMGDFTTKALSPTDTLLHVCVHGAKWSPVPPMRWVADAITIIRVAGDRIDWNRLLRLAQQRRLSLPLSRALGYLSENLRARIPASVLLDLRAMPTTWSERMEYRMFSRPRKPGENYRALPVLWFVHRRLDNARSGFHSVLTFPLYLQHCFALEQFSDLPPFVFSKLMQRGRRRLGWGN